MLVTTGLYAALLGLLSLYLGGTVGSLRGKKKIPSEMAAIPTSSSPTAGT